MAPITCPSVGSLPSEVNSCVTATRLRTSTPLSSTPARTAIIICGPPSVIHTPFLKVRPGAPMRTICLPSFSHFTPQRSIVIRCSYITGSDFTSKA